MIATTPSGEFRYRVRSCTLPGDALAGSGCADTTMGTMASEISTETSMKGVGVFGFDNTSKNCAAPKPTYKTSMYTASSLPRFALLARWLSQLSATT